MAGVDVVPSSIRYELVESKVIAERLGYDVLPDNFRESGSLPGGNYFAVAGFKKTHYYLYPSKEDFIAYFLNHYFDINFVSQNRRMRPYLIRFRGVPVRTFTDYPRLASVGAQPQEIISAVISKLPHLKIVHMAYCGIFISRRDEYYGIDDHRRVFLHTLCWYRRV
ncbi:unnamed protein product [Rodentolepis nana]|uniref:Sulfatase domain-containing protein n=1 Tax=Rodentolepis nana TaxID=102285 RepID=A0A0R3TAI4_RODNA|nr:unnamed protein product [Rodentolepis nana]